ncbi:MAG: PEP-CTERM sorting domain-containing protein [Acidimicrobiia bacterium]|nr:PEP-CTERM sorting domain-containing protein [Acidimicrobiia bacterium]
MTKTSPGVFDLLGIDVAALISNMGGPSFNMTVVGTRPDLTMVNQMLTVFNNPGNPLLQTFSLAGFTGLSSVTLTQGTLGNQNAFQFTNLVVDDTAPIPEPASMLLVASGIGALGLRRRRRRAD